MAQNDSSCAHCGAPPSPGLVACRFCRTPYSANSARNALACPHCGALNEDDNQKCAGCNEWLVYKCLFCAAISPCTDIICQRCREPFAGAKERLAAREEAKRTQEQVKMASQVANAAAPVLGAVAGAIFSGSGQDEDRPSRRRRNQHRSQKSNEGGLLDSLFGSDSSSSGGGGGGILDELLRDTDPSDDGYRGR